MSAQAYPRVASFKTAESLRVHLRRHDIPLSLDDERARPAESPLAQPIDVDGVRVGNRFCILPMEGWDGTRDGEPSELTRRRWRNFGISGAKLMWGGEAVAVRAEARANPNQLLLTTRTQPAIAALREQLVAAHRERFGADADADLYVGLQLTHSGRFARPDVWDRPAPLAAFHHPVLDRRFADGVRVLTDDDIDHLVDDFVGAARLAAGAGFRFVDIKQCHGYLGHELLGARTRPGRYGGSLENRTRFLRQVIEGIRSSVPGLTIVVRLSVFDTVPYRRDATGAGVADESAEAHSVGFGLLGGDMSEGDMNTALADARAVLAMLQPLGIRWICTTAGSPYYNPHIQRPAMFPPMDGYEPPEDPLRGVARQIQATAQLKAAFPKMVFVGSAYSYLQEWLPHVGQHAVREGLTDCVGLGRVALSYPDLPADVLSGAPLKRHALCRTFSDCTTGPRMGLVSGCYPLDPFYTARPESAQVLKKRGAMTRKHYVLVLAAFLLGLGLNHLAAQQKVLGGYIIEHDAEIAKNEPGTHNGGGMTIGYSFFSKVPKMSLVFRKRTFHPGSGVGYHEQQEDEIYYVLSGKGEMTLDGKKVDVTPGTAVLTRPGSSHGLKQVGSEDLVVLINYEQTPK